VALLNRDGSLVSPVPDPCCRSRRLRAPRDMEFLRVRHAAAAEARRYEVHCLAVATAAAGRAFTGRTIPRECAGRRPRRLRLVGFARHESLVTTSSVLRARPSGEGGRPRSPGRAGGPAHALRRATTWRTRERLPPRGLGAFCRGCATCPPTLRPGGGRGRSPSTRAAARQPPNPMGPGGTADALRDVGGEVLERKTAMLACHRPSRGGSTEPGLRRRTGDNARPDAAGRGVVRPFRARGGLGGAGLTVGFCAPDADPLRRPWIVLSPHVAALARPLVACQNRRLEARDTAPRSPPGGPVRREPLRRALSTPEPSSACSPEGPAGGGARPHPGDYKNADFAPTPRSVAPRSGSSEHRPQLRAPVGRMDVRTESRVLQPRRPPRLSRLRGALPARRGDSSPRHASGVAFVLEVLGVAGSGVVVPRRAGSTTGRRAGGKEGGRAPTSAPEFLPTRRSSTGSSATEGSLRHPQQPAQPRPGASTAGPRRGPRAGRGESTAATCSTTSVYQRLDYVELVREPGLRPRRSGATGSCRSPGSRRWTCSGASTGPGLLVWSSPTRSARTG